ncbi:MAG TPA: hypothetical protein VK392_04510 [Thermoanaerobaculia bacterium]|nr:hypothetical protein [Thermoanaerobaculia bacterium]
MTPPSRFAETAWLPMTLSAAAVGFPAAGPAILAFALFLFLALPALAPGPLRRPVLLPAATAVFLFACGMTVFYQPGGPLDLFEDGQILAAADVYGNGGRPYVDTYPIHGWGADGGLDAFLFRIFGPTVETFRARRGVMTAAALVALAAAADALFEPMAWKAVAFLAALCVCPFVSERQLLAFACLAFLIRAARSRRARDLAVSGALGACELFYSLDLGLIVLTGGLAGAATGPFLSSGFRRIGPGARSALAFAGGACAASLPFLLILSRSGALPGFLRTSFLEIPRTIGDIWGLPAGSARALLRADPGTILRGAAFDPSQSGSFLLLLLGAAAAVCLLRSAHGAFEEVDRAAWASIAVAAAATRGLLGRADAGHFALYGVFAGLPAAWLLYRASHAATGRVALTGALLLVLLVKLHPLTTISRERGAVAAGEESRVAWQREGVRVPRSGSATLPRGQASDILALRKFFDSRLAPGETFFDFGNEPGLYFLLERSLPVRFICVPCYESPAHQIEVVTALKRERPPFAILASGSARDAFDGVTNRERTPLVAAYLDANYEPYGEICGHRIGRRKNSPRLLRPESHQPPEEAAAFAVVLDE